MELAHRCGAAGLAERARTELRATGARPRRLVRTGADALTPSERRVAELAAGGRTNREIAAELYVTLATVETHLRHVFQKLDVHARTELRDALAEKITTAPDAKRRAPGARLPGMSTLLTSYYDGPDLTGRVRDALREAGLDPERLRVEDLTAMDQFHALGLAATLALAELAELRPGERVLDIGAGIGGPARVLAARFGARVTAVEPLARFRRLAADAQRRHGPG